VEDNDKPRPKPSRPKTIDDLYNEAFDTNVKLQWMFQEQQKQTKLLQDILTAVSKPSPKPGVAVKFVVTASTIRQKEK